MAWFDFSSNMIVVLLLKYELVGVSSTLQKGLNQVEPNYTRSLI